MNPAPLSQNELQKQNIGMLRYTTNIHHFRMKGKISFSTWTPLYNLVTQRVEMNCDVHAGLLNCYASHTQTI